MFIAIYIVCLSLAAGLTGSFGHAVLAEQGYIGSFESALLVTGGIAAAFVCVQLLFMALLNFVAPTRGGAPLLTEAASNGAAVVLLPFLAHVPLYALFAKLTDGVTHPLLIKLAEMDVVLLPAAFAGVHACMKLFTLFAALHSRPTSRLIAVLWLGAAALAGMGSAEALRRFVDDLTASRVAELPESKVWEVNHVYAEARAVREGTVFRVPLDGKPGRPVVLHVAFPKSEADPPEKVHFVVDVDGTSARPYLQAVPLSVSGWSTLTVPPQEIPANATHCDLLWMTEPEAGWMTRTRIRPIAYGSSELLISGPWLPQQRTDKSPPSMVVIMADGLAAEHTTLAGYARATTPKLEAWSEGTTRFMTCMTPTPETGPALMSAMTGLSPLRHGYLNGKAGTLPEGVKTLAERLSEQGYVCAAFTEGESTAGPQTATPDVVQGKDYERGFALFDQAYPMVPAVQVDGKAMPGNFVPAGSEVTLERVKEFVTAHKEVPFFVLVRLRELASPRLTAGVAGFVGQGEHPKAIDVYDTALQQFDQALGGFLEWLDTATPKGSTNVAVTSSYGYDFESSGNGERAIYLNEPCLHVPLLIRVAGVEGRLQRSPCGTEDLSPTLAKLAGLPAMDGATGNDLLGTFSGKDPISMLGDPLALSLRTKHWRLTWDSGRDPVTGKNTAAESWVEFISVDDYEHGQKQQNQWARQKELADRYRQRLLDYLEGQRGK